TIAHVIAMIPIDVATADLESMLEYAWCHLLVSRPQFLEMVDLSADMASRSAQQDPRLLGRLAMLQSMAATIAGDWAEGGRQASRAMEHLGGESWLDSLGRFGWNLIA